MPTVTRGWGLEGTSVARARRRLALSASLTLQSERTVSLGSDFEQDT